MNKNNNTFEIQTFLKSLKEMENDTINHAEFIKKSRKAIESQLSELNKIVGMLNQFTNINPDQLKNYPENTAGSRKDVTSIQSINNFEAQKPIEGSGSQKGECPDQKMTVIQEPSIPIEGIDKNESGRNEKVLSVFESGKELTFPDIKDALKKTGLVWSDNEENRVRACLGYLVKKGSLRTRKIDEMRKVWFLNVSGNQINCLKLRKKALFN